jgi:hypothetical protein
MGWLLAADPTLTSSAEAPPAQLGHRGETATRCPNGASGRSAIVWMSTTIT